MKVMNQEPGLAVICDKDGKLRSIVANTFCGNCLPEPGQSLLTMLDNNSYERGKEFLQYLKEHHAVFGHMLEVRTSQGPGKLYFSGSQIEDSIVIIATKNSFDVYESVSETVNSGDKHDKVQEETRRQNDQMFDKMSRLNNELVNLQREIAIKNVRLEQLNQQKNQFLGMATHDLRNPLASIISGCRLIERGVATGDKIMCTVQEIHKVSAFMLHLVEDLLDTSKIESGKLVVEKLSTDINEMISRIISLYQSQATQKDIQLSLECSESLPMLDIDADKIEQVLENLISNAIKFSYKGTKVRVLAEIVNDELIIMVEDQGQGIPEQELGKLFKPFSRTSVRPTGGESSSGMGLSIVKKIVEAHQGRIGVESQPGVGSRFILALPI